MTIVMKVMIGGHQDSVVAVAVGSLVAPVVEAVSVVGLAAAHLMFAEDRHSGHDHLLLGAEVNFSCLFQFLCEIITSSSTTTTTFILMAIFHLNQS